MTKNPEKGGEAVMKETVREIEKIVEVERKITFVEMAKIAHEVNRAYCQALGDDSQLVWEEAPQWQRDSIIHGVTFHAENPGAGPEASHESWLKEKEADGWVYGEVKDAEKKEHPCFLPFVDLPKEQQAKDYLFRAIVHAVLGIPYPEPEL